MDESNTKGPLIHLYIPFSKFIAIRSSSLIVSALVLPSLIPILHPLKANHLSGCNDSGKRCSSVAISYWIRRVIQLTLGTGLRTLSRGNCSRNPLQNQRRIARAIDSYIIETSISMRCNLTIIEKYIRHNATICVNSELR